MFGRFSFGGFSYLLVLRLVQGTVGIFVGGVRAQIIRYPGVGRDPRRVWEVGLKCKGLVAYVRNLAYRMCLRLGAQGIVHLRPENKKVECNTLGAEGA